MFTCTRLPLGILMALLRFYLSPLPLPLPLLDMLSVMKLFDFFLGHREML